MVSKNSKHEFPIPTAIKDVCITYATDKFLYILHEGSQNSPSRLSNLKWQACLFRQRNFFNYICMYIYQCITTSIPKQKAIIRKEHTIPQSKPADGKMKCLIHSLQAANSNNFSAPLPMSSCYLQRSFREQDDQY